ncbi:MAG: hypothetical protein ACM37W_05570 [Actinomycetota bacterium]
MALRPSNPLVWELSLLLGVDTRHDSLKKGEFLLPTVTESDVSQLNYLFFALEILS